MAWFSTLASATVCWVFFVTFFVFFAGFEPFYTLTYPYPIAFRSLNDIRGSGEFAGAFTIDEHQVGLNGILALFWVGVIFPTSSCLMMLLWPKIDDRVSHDALNIPKWRKIATRLIHFTCLLAFPAITFLFTTITFTGYAFAALLGSYWLFCLCWAGWAMLGYGPRRRSMARTL
jgi:hypothetical protein